MTRAGHVIETLVFIGAIALQAVAILSISDNTLRAVIGSFLLIGIMLVTIRLARRETPTGSETSHLPERYSPARRFLRLRSSLDRFVADVRLLNRIAVDLERGFRSRDSAENEMRRIETRMTEMVHQFRVSATIETKPA